MDDHLETLRRLLLRVPNRRRIHEHIMEGPGVHARALARALDLAVGVVEHHLRVLEQHDMVFAIDANGRRGYFTEGRVDPADAPLLMGLRNDAWRAVAEVLLAGEHNVSQIAARLGQPPTTTAYTLARMRAAGWVARFRVGRESVYTLQEPGRVEGLLRRDRIDVGQGFEALLRRAAASAPPALPRLRH